MKNIKIRNYNSNDYQQVCRVHDLARRQEMIIGGAEKYFEPLESAMYREDFFSCEILVAVISDKIVGFIATHPHELDYIYVDPAYQRKGIGKALANAALSHLLRPVTLDVFVENENAKCLYRSLGFKTVSVEYSQWYLDDPKKYSGEKMILE